ncbi:uncharacterized protein IL334_000509 [Kwoniella shivajii]|uniref:Nudix hydrolase domain-containing protein n=1 Tax=Kwoniella shivajii TaxID=564305 RepID=A0ABZ1CPL8_9TREE|nr:hypothetical protein IL334_000509 [Kwoniella shivajii]
MSNEVSLLKIIKSADNFPSYSTPYPQQHPLTGKRLVPFYLTFKDFQHRIPPIGVFPTSLLKELRSEKGLQFYSILQKIGQGKGGHHKNPSSASSKTDQGTKNVSEPKREHEEVHTKEDKGKNENEKSKVEKKGHNKDDYKVIVLAVFFSDDTNSRGKDGRTEVMIRIVNKWREEGKFPDAMKLWMDELFAIYASPHSTLWKDDEAARNPFGNVAFEIERAATPIFGFTALGVHMTAFEGQGDDTKIWAPRRSANRIRSPLKYDSSVAGGIPAGMTPLQALIKECEEEAGWFEVLVRKYVKSAGMISLFEITRSGDLAPDIDYVYDLPLPSRESKDYVLPSPNDEEVDSFELLTIPEVFAALRNQEFKPTSAVATIDFLIRHGFITPENEPDYSEIVKRCHRRSGIAGPGI